MGNKFAQLLGAGLVYFFEYETFKVVHIRSIKLGAVNRLLQIAILGFVIGYVIIYEKGYQQFDSPVSSVTTKVKGIGVGNTSHGHRIFDVPDYVVPAQMKDSFFVMTNAVITYRQNQSVCPEDPNIPGVICSPDRPGDCHEGFHDMLGNGVQTGRCVPSDQKPNVTVCEIMAWCPVEVDATPTIPLIPEAENFTVLIKNSITFSAFNVRRRNILDTQDSSFLKTCEYNSNDKLLKLCPIFKLGTIIREAGVNFLDAAVNGAVISIAIVWNCDLDYSVEDCIPSYKFSRLDEPDPKIAPGFNFRYANYWQNENHEELRTMYKAYGILFIVQVEGKGGKFDPIPLATNLGSGLALLAIVSVICDILLLYCVKMKDVYRKKKYLIVTGDDAFNAQVLSGGNGTAVESTVESTVHRRSTETDEDLDLSVQVADDVRILPTVKRASKQTSDNDDLQANAVNANSNGYNYGSM